MANVLYKTVDDTKLVGVPDPANPYQPPGSGLPGTGWYPPPVVPPSTDDSGYAFTYYQMPDGSLVQCGLNGCEVVSP